MASGGFFRGTSVDQDSRFFNQNKKLLAKLSFPPCFDQKVDLSKVKREVISQWITERVTQLLGFEDDIVVSMIINLLDTKVDEKLDPKQMQLTITGFLEKDTPVFMNELWELLLSAQSHPTGIPPAILEKKKLEMAKAAQEKQTLRQVLDRKQQDARGSGAAREDRRPVAQSEPPSKSYGLNNRGRDRPDDARAHDTRGRERNDRAPHRRRERSRSSRRHRRSPSRSVSRSPSWSRSRSPHRRRARSRSQSRRRAHRSRRSPSRSVSRGSPSDRSSPSSSPDRRKQRSRSATRQRRRSPSQSPSPDPFGRRPRPSSKARSRSPSA